MRIPDYGYVIIIGIIGIVLLSTSTNIQFKLQKCTNKNVRRANMILLIISSMFIGIAISYFIYRCRSSFIGEKMYLMFLFALGLTLIGLGSTMITQANVAGCKNIKDDVSFITGFGAFISLISFVLLLMNLRK